jgi:transcriptional regulator with XRE-family HTH domain
MTRFSTRQAAKKLGITHATLSRYLKARKIPQPQTATGGGMTVHLWTDEEIEHTRELLPKIANGRKTRWQREREAGTKKAKTKAPARVPVPHKQKSDKKK